MVVMITNAKPAMISRFMESNMGDKIAWIGETLDGNIMCLDDSAYCLESGYSYKGIEFINIRSENNCFTIYNGEYNTLIVE